jgi:hypothetical protein
MIFIRNPHGAEHISELASKFGLVFGETEGTARSPSQPGFVGNTFPIKEQLRAAGAAWHSGCKAWVFDSWDAALAALVAIKG